MGRRKNFLPSFLLSIFFWLCLIYVILFTAPDSIFSILIFYFFLALSLFLTLSLVLANTRRGFILTLGIIIAIILQQVKLLNILNLILLGGILLSLELFFSHR